MKEFVALKPIGIKKQPDAFTVVTPDTFVPYYSQSMATDPGLVDDTPAYGGKFKRFQTLQGNRKHTGSVTVMAEPNTAARWLDMLATKGSTTGTGPYTHPFGADDNTDPNYYTVDMLLGSQVVRFWGVAASKITIGWDGPKMQFQNDLSGLGSFYGREIASVSTTTIVLKTDYDPYPTTGLVAADLVKITKNDGSSSMNTTIASITDGITLVLGDSAASFAAGDMIVLRMPTPTLSILKPFILPRTQFFFAADAATALTNSATPSNQTRLEPGMGISIMHAFKSNDGEPRSGAYDPASLIRTQYDVSAKVKQVFNTTDGIKKWNAVTKQALVMRAYAGNANQYELRVTLNDLRTKTKAIPTDSGTAIYQEDDLSPNYDQTDGQGFDVKVINAISTI